MDVLTAAWTAAGAPLALPARDHGRCARCARTAALARAGDAVSAKFSRDGWASSSAPGLCPACAWAYRAPELRRLITLVTAAPPSISHPRPPAAAAMLRQALSQRAALVVPLRPGRRHILPSASWGKVTTEDAALPWTAADARRLAAMTWLRDSGFGSRMLAAPAPPWPALRRLDPAGRAEAIAGWRELAPWRARPPWLSLAVRLTIPAAP